MSAASSYDVLVIGAGPAGSAAARSLAQAGHEVVVIDQQAFPRDKVCGDALIADALGALATLGLDRDVRNESWAGDELRVYAPAGRHVSLAGEYASLPRERFDAILLDGALRAGATFVHATVMSALGDGDRVTGVRVKARGAEGELHARFTILATGANVTVLQAFGLPAPGKPDAVAGRAYFQASQECADSVRCLTIAYDRRWSPGYGWIFPAPGNRFNVGVGLFGGAAAQGALRRFFESFCRSFPLARQVIDASTLIREFRGAPIRSGLSAQSFGRRGLVGVGEAVATTYSATGEGIGKAMESGLLAAEMISDALRGARDAARVHDDYRDEFRRRFVARYRAYRTAQRWASSPAMLNLLAWRSHAGSFVQRELEAVVAERGDASALFSTAGLIRALVR